MNKGSWARVVTAITALFCVSASYACDKVAPGYERFDAMFVVCKGLSGHSNDEISDLIINLFNQYKGPPDEVAIYFVSNKNLIGKPDITDDGLVGFYYTRDNNLVLWPNSDNQRKTLQVVWK